MVWSVDHCSLPSGVLGPHDGCLNHFIHLFNTHHTHSTTNRNRPKPHKRTQCLSAAEQAELPEGYAGGLFVARLPDDMPGGAEETRFGTAAAEEWARRSGGKHAGVWGGQGFAAGAANGGGKDALGSGLLVGAAAVALAAACLYYSAGGVSGKF